MPVERCWWICNAYSISWKLNEVDTTGVEPLILHDRGVRCVARRPSFLGHLQEEALMNAPVKDSDYFKVPRVVDKGA